LPGGFVESLLQVVDDLGKPATLLRIHPQHGAADVPLHPLLDALARPRPTRPTHRDPRNLTARIAEAEREGWLGEVEGLKISLAGAEDKLAQIERRTRNQNTVELGIPTRLSRR
jgi:hypothetical protein